MARILLLHETEHEHGAGILLLSLPTCTHCPTYRQDLAPLRLRTNPINPLTPEHVACIVLLPEPTSLVPIRLRAEHD
ncbi:uncharacterized protein K441DRAFT_652634 [Cenococcum geophilum 1.58]|uniref:uncharacterized protein n=1 Tax=Cenococcum geophilum 1.58 TaxID=794803 RepID=UPI00358FFCB8|nr:hypothetical protein K441DRAFT_652634 [Cenococcum geophilum 1.58]